MDLPQDQMLSSLKAELLAELREYMTEEDRGYGESDVARCGEIMDEHLAAVSAAEDGAEGLDCVRRTVLKLNALNSKCAGGLIETGERERICAFIIRAGALRGFSREDEDLTEEWREW